tara:strand:+ start:133 stop:444 length:312 start_codon:yes stop_codon:yes gene_type:complete
MTWFSILIAGIVTYLSRMTMVTIIKREMLNDKIKEVLVFVPSAVFPAIIFPGVFFNDYGNFVELSDPKIFGALIAIVVGFYSKNIIFTILSGLISYWVIIFLL